jgi:hypothetical protein
MSKDVCLCSPKLRELWNCMCKASFVQSLPTNYNPQVTGSTDIRSGLGPHMMLILETSDKWDFPDMLEWPQPWDINNTEAVIFWNVSDRRIENLWGYGCLKWMCSDSQERVASLLKRRSQFEIPWSNKQIKMSWFFSTCMGFQKFFPLAFV